MEVAVFSSRNNTFLEAHLRVNSKRKWNDEKFDRSICPICVPKVMKMSPDWFFNDHWVDNFEWHI